MSLDVTRSARSVPLHEAPDEAVKTQLEELGPHAGAALVLYRRKRVLDN